ncbi:unnamed protein product [Rotaria magnacalcarata]|uniref:Uncharacterized protein n=4 Tax=Rotaria magnacalcarata TaxID=392030 RepID=A0A816KK00_9BILA|nr:unnamed protein product [Rotaria magnacalcarata]CAF1654440.1 unnamed protein product [Rotaria magnacalcarata]CAF1923270.1 unnamed protein product [Rotaria magnacalcarata]CAF2053008.1 unnamed protein product [Rotaria magnacalcarata]CAF3889560.1 unnamed protein product [Rotaria magnacalcarata]
MSQNNLSAKDEALLILEYLENEQMSKTFLNFLDESKHLNQLRSNLYANYEKYQHENTPDKDCEVSEFQKFFNLSKHIVSQLNRMEENDQITFLLDKSSNDLNFDDDFLNDLVSQTPPMDYQNYLPETPIPSVLPSIVNNENDDFNSIEQLFALQHETLSEQMGQSLTDASPRVSVSVPYTKCIVVTQDFLQTMYNQQSTITNNTNNSVNYVQKPKRRRRRLKVGKENFFPQRKIMPRTSPDHR